MFPVGFLLQFDTKVLRYESVFIIIIKKKNSLIFWGWLFVTYGIDLVSIPRYYILVSYRSQNYGIEPSLHESNFIFGKPLLSYFSSQSSITLYLFIYFGIV